MKIDKFKQQLHAKLFEHWRKQSIDPTKTNPKEWKLNAALFESWYPGDEALRRRAYNYVMRNGRPTVLKCWELRHQGKSAQAPDNSVKARIPSAGTVNTWQNFFKQNSTKQPSSIPKDLEGRSTEDPDLQNNIEFGTRNRATIKYLKEVRTRVRDQTTKAVQAKEAYPFPSLWIYPPQPFVRERHWTVEERDSICYPRVFVFDPEHWGQGGVTIFCDGCLASGCTEKGNRKWVSDGFSYKRVHDLSGDSEYYILFRTYRCREKATCAQFKNCDKESHTFNILNPKTFAALPSYVQEAFPAVLRGSKGPALDKTLVDMMYACCADSTGMSSNSFSKALAEVAHQGICRKKAMYYSRAHGVVSGLKCDDNVKISIPKYKDVSPATPKCKTLSRCLSDRMSLAYKNHVARLAVVNPSPGGVPGVLKSDTSFKVKKSVRFGRCSTNAFAGQESVMDGYGQVYISALMSTLSQAERETLLNQMTSRFKSIGATIGAYFVDNCCTDGKLFERALRGVAHQNSVEDQQMVACAATATLEYMEFQEAVYIDTVAVANDVTSTILDNMKLGHLPRYCGLDLEWTPHPKVVPGSPNDFHTDVVTLAFPSMPKSHGKVFVFFTRAFKSEGNATSQLPVGLRTILQDPLIVKAGLNINNDVAHLTSQNSFPGTTVCPTVDIRQLAKQLGVVPLANGSLKDLARTVLDLEVDKQCRIRNWSKSFRFDRQMKDYAATDAALHLRIYQKLVSLSDRNAAMKSLDEVLIFDRSLQSIAAIGVVQQAAIRTFTGGEETKIAISSVISPSFMPRKEKKSLGQLRNEAGGEVFSITIPNCYVRVRDDMHNRRILQEQHAELSGSDKSASPNGTKFVKLDVYHAMTRVLDTLPKNHGAFKRFASRLSDAFFNVSASDRDAAITEVKRANGWTDEQAEMYSYYHYDRILQKCRRFIPEPCQLKKNLQKVYDLYHDCKDATSNISLFSDTSKSAWNKLMKHVEKGCLSDPPGMAMYFSRGAGPNPDLKSKRGTSQLENFHNHLRRSFHHAYNVSPQNAVFMLAELVTRWNQRVQVQSMGAPDYGCYNFSKMEEIALWAEAVGVVEFPYLTLTADYKMDASDHNFFMSTMFKDSLDARTTASDSDEELSDISDDDCWDQFDAFEQISHDVDVDSVIGTILNIADHRGVESNRENSVDRSHRTTATPSEVQVHGSRGLVNAKQPSVCEITLWRELYPAFYFTASTNASTFTAAWNVIVERILLDSRFTKKPILRPINNEVAEALLKSRKQASNTILTLEPVREDDKQLRTFLTSQEPESMPALEKVQLSPRKPSEDVRNSPQISQWPLQEPRPSWIDKSEQSLFLSHLQPKEQHNQQFCKLCGHLRDGFDTYAFHSNISNGFKKGHTRVCALANYSQSHAKFVRKRDRNLDFDYKNKSLQENLLNPRGCPYCLAGVAHPSQLFNDFRKSRMMAKSLDSTESTQATASNIQSKLGFSESVYNNGKSTDSQEPLQVQDDHSVPGLTREQFSNLTELQGRCRDLVKNNRATNAVLNINNYAVSAQNFMTLMPCAWLDDIIVNSYSYILNLHFGQKVYFMNTQFLPMINKLNDDELILRSFKNVLDQFRYADLVIVPVHHGTHWATGVIDFGRVCLEYYDSLSFDARAFFDPIKRFLKLKCSEDRYRRWLTLNLESISPKQVNGYDCGVFMLCTMRCRAMGSKFDFSQDTIDHERQRIGVEVSHRELIDRSALRSSENQTLLVDAEILHRTHGLCSDPETEKKWKQHCIDVLSMSKDCHGVSLDGQFEYCATIVNGDCLFDAVRLGMHRPVTELTIRHMRDSVAQLLSNTQNNECFYGLEKSWPFFAGVEAKQYIDAVRIMGHYEELLSVFALSIIYNISIQIIAVKPSNSGKFFPQNVNSLVLPPRVEYPPSQFITLALLANSSHYVSLKRRNVNENEQVGNGLLPRSSVSIFNLTMDSSPRCKRQRGNSPSASGKIPRMS